MQTLKIKNENGEAHANHPAMARCHHFDFYFMHSNFQKGFGVIELIIVTAIIIIALTGFLQAGIFATRLLHAEQESLEATMLAQEGMEAVRSVRDESWTNNIAPLANGTAYYPIVVNSKWTLSSVNPGFIQGIYTRRVMFDQVVRDGQYNIAPAGAVDENTKKATIMVSWGNKQVNLVAYLTNFQEQFTLPKEVKVVSYEGASNDTDIINFPSDNAGDGDPAQSFTTPASAINVTRVDALLRRMTSAPSDIYAEIRTSPTGMILGVSNIISAQTIAANASAWVEFRFAPEVPLAPSTAYFIRLRSIPSSVASNSGSQGSLRWIFLQTSTSPYSGGIARRYVGRQENAAYTGEQLDQDDFGFRVYAVQ